MVAYLRRILFCITSVPCDFSIVWNRADSLINHKTVIIFFQIVVLYLTLIWTRKIRKSNVMQGRVSVCSDISAPALCCLLPIRVLVVAVSAVCLKWWKCSKRSAFVATTKWSDQTDTLVQNRACKEKDLTPGCCIWLKISVLSQFYLFVNLYNVK